MIDNDSPQLEAESIVLKNQQSSEHLLQFILKNNSSMRYQVRTIELRLYDKNSQFLEFKNYFLDEQIVRPRDDMAIEFFLEDISTLGHACIKIRAVRWFNSDRVAMMIIITLALIILALKCSSLLGFN